MGVIRSNIESVYSINRDEPDSPKTKYITNGGISRARYNITHFKHHHRVLRLISNRMCVQHRHNSAVYKRATQSKKSTFGLLILILIKNEKRSRDGCCC